MRISVTGDCESAKVLRRYLAKEDFVVYDRDVAHADYLVVLGDGGDKILFDSIDCPLEARAFAHVRRLTSLPVEIQTAGGNQSDRELRVVIPYSVEAQRAVELGVFRAFLEIGAIQKEAEQAMPKEVQPGLWERIRKAFVPLGLIVMAAGSLQAQQGQVFRVPGGGTASAGDAVNNAIRVNVVAGAAAGGTSSSFSAAFPATGTAAGASDGTDMKPFLVNGSGFLRVVCESGTCGGAASFDDNSAFTFGTTSIGVTGFVFDDVAPNTVTENRAATPRMSANRVAYSQIRDAAGNERGANVTAGNALVVDASATTQPVSGTVTVTDGAGALNVIVDSGTVTANLAAGTNNIGDVDVATIAAGDNNIGNVDVVSLPALPAGANNIGDVDVLTVPADPFGVNADAASATGSISAKLRFIAATGIPVTSLPNVTVGTFPDNEPFNVGQINGVTPLMGNGVTGTGSQRVTIASDNTAFTVNVGTFPDNEPINVAQMNGVAVTMGNGAAGTGVQRVTIASDSTGSVAVTQATASSLNAQVVGAGATDSGVTGNPVLIAGRSEDSADSAPGLRVTAEGEAVPISMTRDGVIRTIMGGPQSWSYHENSSSTLTDTTVHASGGTGLFNYICTVVVSTGAATAFNLFIEDSTTATILGPFYLEAVAGRGAALNFSPCKKQTNSATLISVTTSAAIAHSIDITGYVGE